MLYNHLVRCCPLLLLPSIFPSIRVFSNESVLHIKWPKYWSFSFSISPSSEYSGLISFRIDWFDLLAVQGTWEFSPAPPFKSINSWELSLPFGPILTTICDCSHEIQRHLLLGRKVMSNLDCVLKCRDITLSTKICLVKASLPSSHIWLWELDQKEGWVPKNWCF